MRESIRSLGSRGEALRFEAERVDGRQGEWSRALTVIRQGS